MQVKHKYNFFVIEIILGLMGIWWLQTEVIILWIFIIIRTSWIVIKLISDKISIDYKKNYSNKNVKKHYNNRWQWSLEKIVGNDRWQRSLTMNRTSVWGLKQKRKKFLKLF